MSILGATQYEINRLLGGMLYKPDESEVNLYSGWTANIQSNTGGRSNNLTPVNQRKGAGSRHKKLPGESKSWSDIIGNNLTAYYNEISKDEWEEGDWFLFGMTSLPWNAPPPVKGKKDLYAIKKHGGNMIPNTFYEPGVLSENLMTIAKVVVPLLILFFGGKFVLQKYNYI